MEFKEAVLKLNASQLRPMAKVIVNKTIDTGTTSRVFNILRGAGKKVKVIKDKEVGSEQRIQIEKKIETDEACWDSHKQVGTKKKGGKTVPNCVPKEGVKSFKEVRKSVSQMTPAEKAADAKKRKEYNAYQKSKRNESVELDEAIDYFKVSKELSDYAKKHGGPDKREFEKAAAYVLVLGKNSALSVADKAGKGLNMLFKNADTDVRDRMQMILTKGGFKVKGGYVMRESVEIEEAVEDWTVTVTKPVNKLKKGAAQKVKARSAFEAINKAIKLWGDPALKAAPTSAFKITKESVEEAKAPGKLGPNASREDKIKHTMKIMKMYPANKGKSEKELRKGATDYIDQVKIKNKKTDDWLAKMASKKESVDEATLEEKTKWKMGDGRPRNGARIENERFWNLPYDSLKYIAKDAGEAMKANPTARKATTGKGNWADQVADAATVMQWRKKNGIRESVDEAGQSKNFAHLRIGPATGQRKLKPIDKLRNAPNGGGDMKYNKKKASTKKNIDDLLYKRQMDKLKKEDCVDETKEPSLKSSDYPKGTSQSAQAFKDKFAKKKKPLPVSQKKTDKLRSSIKKIKLS
tara:strand:- start:2093 stop:3829 length:1737 start_codon:yes stop_codon:yes gene_type:complete